MTVLSIKGLKPVYMTVNTFLSSHAEALMLPAWTVSVCPLVVLKTIL